MPPVWYNIFAHARNILFDPYGNLSATSVQAAIQELEDEKAALSYVNANIGAILQVRQVIKTNAFTTASASFVDITDMSVSITPTSVSNKILIVVNLSASANTTDASTIRLLRGASEIGSGVSGSTFNGLFLLTSRYDQEIESVGAVILDSPATVSSTTYKLQAKTPGNVFINRRGYDASWGASSSITVMEVKG